jgi:hypothetical protein
MIAAPPMWQMAMALMLVKLYDALCAGGVPDEQAREAAKGVASNEKDPADIRAYIGLLKWISGPTPTGVLAVLMTVLTA